jgi:hypothetical protein
MTVQFITNGLRAVATALAGDVARNDVEAVVSQFGLNIGRCTTEPTPALCYHAMNRGS